MRKKWLWVGIPLAVLSASATESRHFTIGEGLGTIQASFPIQRPLDPEGVGDPSKGKVIT
jgi:hypothetical protein